MDVSTLPFSRRHGNNPISSHSIRPTLEELSRGPILSSRESPINPASSDTPTVCSSWAPSFR